VLTSATLTVGLGKPTSRASPVSGFEHILPAGSASPWRRELVVPLATSTIRAKRCSICRRKCPTRAIPTTSRRPPTAPARVLEDHPRPRLLPSSPATRPDRVHAPAPRRGAALPAASAGHAQRAPSCWSSFRDTPGAILFRHLQLLARAWDVLASSSVASSSTSCPSPFPPTPSSRHAWTAVAAAGGNSLLRNYQVPSAVLSTLKQGFGRLIRSLKDRGVLMPASDPRIHRQAYRRLSSSTRLPRYRPKTQSIEGRRSPSSRQNE